MPKCIQGLLILSVTILPALSYVFYNAGIMGSLFIIAATLGTIAFAATVAYAIVLIVENC